MESATPKYHLYDVREELKPLNLLEISAEQIDDHWNLYKGYVKQVNTLNEELLKLREAGEVNSLAYADRRRRYGFEYNGMVLHEYYFDNLKNNQDELESGDLLKAMAQSFGCYNTWKKDFEAAAKSRAIGWAILYADATTGALTNHFIAEHGNGNVAGFVPVLVLDVWEHAYMVDHLASGRGDYIAAFMKNINWDKAQERYNDVLNRKLTPRF